MIKPAADRLKDLNERKKKTLWKLNSVRATIADLNKEIQELNGELAGIESQIQILSVQTKEVTVSEHAMLRYLERIKGMDLEALKTEIIDDAVKGKIMVLGSCNIPDSTNTYRIVVKNNNVITITSI